MKTSPGFHHAITLFRTVKDGPTVHALAHSLSTVLVYLRETLFKISFADNVGFLTAVWTKYGPYEDILNALSDLYGRVRYCSTYARTPS